MVWDILLQAAAGFFIGAAVGYGLAAIIVDALSRAFARLWENLVATSKEIWVCNRSYPTLFGFGSPIFRQ